MLVEMPYEIYKRYSKQIENRWGRHIIENIYNIDRNTQVIIIGGAVDIIFRTRDTAKKFYESIAVYGGEKKLLGIRVKMYPAKRRRALLIEDSVYRSIEKIADKRGVSISSLVNMALIKYIIEYIDPSIYSEEVGWRRTRNDDNMYG